MFPPTRTYQAFISYSHTADSRLARALQRGLMRIGKPWYRRSPIKVFRDETSLSASPQLWTEIERHLADSEYFLLMASPLAAASPWVRREVAWWLANRGAQSILIIVSQGEIMWNLGAADFDWNRTTCLPPELRRSFDGEPLYVDLRWTSGMPDLSLRHSRFRDAILSLAAPLYRKPKDELDSDEIRQHRRFRMAVIGGSITLVALLLAIGIAIWFVQYETKQANTNWLEAESRKLANKASSSLQSEGTVDDAIKLAVMAWTLAPTDEAEAMLEKLAVVSSDMARVLGQHTSGVVAQAFSPNGTLLATLGGDGSIQLWNTATWTPAAPMLPGSVRKADGIAFNDSATHLVVWSHDGSLERWQIADRSQLAIQAFRQPGTHVSSVSLSADGQLIALGGRDGLFALWDARTGTARQFSDIPDKENDISNVQFTPAGQVLTVLRQSEAIRVGIWSSTGIRLRLGPVTHVSHGLGYGGNRALSRDGKRLAIAGEGGLGLWAIDADLALHPLPAVKPKFEAVTADFDGSGQRLYLQKTGFPVGQWESWSLSSAPILSAEGPLMGQAAWSPDGRWRAELHHGGRTAGDPSGQRVQVWDTTQPGGSTLARSIQSDCRFRGDESGCIRRLCDKIAPSLNEESLKKLFGIENFVLLYDKYRQLTGTTLCAKK